MNDRDDRGRFTSESDRHYIHAQAEKIATAIGIKKGLEKRIGALVDLSDLHVEGDGTVSGLRDRVTALKAEHPAWFAGALDLSKVPDDQIVDALREHQRELDDVALRAGSQALRDEHIDWNTVPEDELDETIRTKILERRTP